MCDYIIFVITRESIKTGLVSITLSYSDIMEVSLEINKYFSLVTDVIIIALVLIAILLHVGWTTVVVSNLRKQFTKRRRIKNEDSIEDMLECATKITHGKFLLVILTLEFIVGISYLIGSLYPKLYHISPIFNTLALPLNTTCITTMERPQLQYPVTGVSFSLARSAMIFGMGVAISFLRFISNSFVDETFKYKKIYRPLKYSLLVAIVIFIVGIAPQSLMLSMTLEVLVFPILCFQMIKHTIFLKMVVRFRRQDLYHNSEEYLLKLHDRQNKYFMISIKCFIVALVFAFLTETLITIEMLFSLILYYGKCFFPLLYDIQYEGMISEDQLPTLNTVLFVFSILEISFSIIALVVFLLPYLILTILLCVRDWRVRKQIKYRYNVALKYPLL